MIGIQPAELQHLIAGYQLCAATEGKSPNAIAIVTSSVSYFQDFLTSQRINTDATRISHHEIRVLILYLQQKRCFSNHRFNHAQDRGLSGHTVNCYLRSLRIYFSWLVSEGIIGTNPFDRVKIPQPPRKVIPTFTDSQIQQLLDAINIKTPEGYRDYAMILTLLDTGMRVSELCHLKLDNVWLEDGMLKVLGKGNKERLIPIGKQVQRCLWRYISRFRPDPATANSSFLFLTRDGKPMTKDRVDGGYLASVLKACGGMVDFKLTNAYSPTLFSHNGYQVVVMPMLTNEANDQAKADREAKGEATTTEQAEPTAEVETEPVAEAEPEATNKPNKARRSRKAKEAVTA